MLRWDFKGATNKSQVVAMASFSTAAMAVLDISKQLSQAQSVNLKSIFEAWATKFRLKFNPLNVRVRGCHVCMFRCLLCHTITILCYHKALWFTNKRWSSNLRIGWFWLSPLT